MVIAEDEFAEAHRGQAELIQELQSFLLNPRSSGVADRTEITSNCFNSSQ